MLNRSSTEPRRNGIRFALLALLGLGSLLSHGNAYAEAPQRIVSVGGALTEIVYALGEETRLVGVDTTSQWPKSAKELPQVGYQRRLSAEGLLSLSPDHILATTDAGPPNVLEQIRSAGIPLTLVPPTASPQGVIDKITSIAELLNVEDKGRKLIAEMQQQQSDLQQRLSNAQSKPSIVFLLSAGKGAPMAAGTETAADAMIKLAGGRNAVADFSQYKPLSTEALVAADPDYLLLTSRTLKGLGGMKGLGKLPGIRLTRAWQQKRIIEMDGLLLLGFGPRYAQAATQLAQQLHRDQLAATQP